MDKFPLAQSFAMSIKDNVVRILADVGEVGLDSLLEDEIIKGIPILSTVCSIYSIGKTIRERHNIAKLYTFMETINNGIVDEEQRRRYIDNFKTNAQKRHQELTYVMIILDRYIALDKSRFLAKIYTTYLEGKISWQDVCKYAEVVDRFLPGDYEMLVSSDAYKTEKDVGTDALQRLIALGLVIEEIRKSNVIQERGELHIDPPPIMEKKERQYRRTEFGNVLVEIIEK